MNSDKLFAVLNPADDTTIDMVADFDVEAASAAIDAVAAAQCKWANSTGDERADLLSCWHLAILANLEELALTATLESGKPLSESRAEITYAASFVRWFAEEARRVDGEILCPTAPNARRFVWREPVGVVAAITPWNFPAAMITRKVAPALASGCGVVLKPSDLTPLTALALATLLAEAGAPESLLSVVPCRNAGSIGALFATDPRVAKISFTGSTEVGRHLAALSAGRLKRLSLELGGNAPFIVFSDIDCEEAVEQVIAAKFRNCGQTCVAANRIYVQREMFSRFVDHLTERVERMIVAPGTEDPDLGPLISRAAVGRVSGLVEMALSAGARKTTRAESDQGAFMRPVVIVEANSSMELVRREIFGPVATVMPFDSEDDVVALANIEGSGLASYLMSADAERLLELAGRMRCGMVGLNTGSVSHASAPFGGIGLSGYGREGSKHGLDDYTSLKAIHWQSVQPTAPGVPVRWSRSSIEEKSHVHKQS